MNQSSGPIKYPPMLTWLVKVSSFTVLLRVVAMLVTLGFVAGMSHLIGKEDFGVLAMLMSLVTFAATIGGFGQSEWTVREASPLHSEGNSAGVQAIFGEMSRRVLIVATPVGFCVGVFFWWHGDGAIVAISSFAVTVLLSICLAWAGAARSIDKFFWSLAPKDILWRMGTLVITFVFITFGLNLQISQVTIVLTLVLLIAVLFQGRSLALSPRQILRAPSGTSDAWLTGLQLMLSMAAISAQNTMDVFFVGSFMSPADAAEYFPANRIALVAGFFFLPFQMIVGPRFASLTKKGDFRNLNKLSTIATLILAVASFSVTFILYEFYDVYAKLFDTASLQTETATKILIFGPAISSLLGFAEAHLIMHKRQALLTNINLVFLAVSLISIPIVAMTGSIVSVSYAVTILLVLRKFAVASFVAIQLGIWPVSISALKRK